MLLHTQDLDFRVTHTPDTFAHYRYQVEQIVQVRPPLLGSMFTNGFLTKMLSLMNGSIARILTQQPFR